MCGVVLSGVINYSEILMHIILLITIINHRYAYTVNVEHMSRIRDIISYNPSPKDAFENTSTNPCLHNFPHFYKIASLYAYLFLKCELSIKRHPV